MVESLRSVMYRRNLLLPPKKSKVRNPETPTRLNALVFSFRRRTPPLRTPASACGCRRKIAGPRSPSSRYAASTTTLRAVPISVQIRAHLQKSVRHEIFRRRHGRLASCLCGRNPRHSTWYRCIPPRERKLSPTTTCPLRNPPNDLRGRRNRESNGTDGERPVFGHHLAWSYLCFFQRLWHVARNDTDRRRNGRTFG